MGAGNNGNLSPLQYSRHQAYHSIAGHPTPDMNLRRMLLSGLTRSGGRNPEPITMEEFWFTV